MITTIEDKIINLEGFRMIEQINTGIRIYYQDNSFLDIETENDIDMLMDRLEKKLKQSDE